MCGMIENGLSKGEIEHLPVQSRIKDSESAWQKVKTKRYVDPFQQMTDYVGLRIVVFLESDIEKTREIVESLFEIDEKNSVDKRIPERSDVVGYRSLHLICSLGSMRKRLPEYVGINAQKFEVQIRSALQHTWAEIEHKRNYKGHQALPDELQHRLMVLAGTIELLDREFSQISKAATDYEESVRKRDNSDSQELISEIAMDAILSREFQKFELTPPSIRANDFKGSILDELTDFGITTLGQFEKLVKSIDLELVARHYHKLPNATSVGLLRDLMLISDAEKYFSSAHKGRWQGTSYEDVDYLNKASGRKDLGQILQSNNIDLFTEQEF